MDVTKAVAVALLLGRMYAARLISVAWESLTSKE
jgi:hypothetical protein